MLNDRPIGLKDNDPIQGTYLCPNEYLLGRTRFGYPGSEWMKTDGHLAFIREIEDSFWKRWMRHYFPTLMIQKKWPTYI